MGKFKVGDKVRILPTVTEDKYENINGLSWAREMGELVGEVHTIDCIFENGRISTGGWTWLPEDIELAQGLEKGDYVDASEVTGARFQYVKQRAKELGIPFHEYHASGGVIMYVQLMSGKHVITRAASGSPNDMKKKTRLSFMEFISRMENGVIKRLEVTEIGANAKYTVDIENGRVKIGCYDLDFATVGDIYECTIPVKHIKVKGQVPKFNDVLRYAVFGPDEHRISYDDIAAIYNLIIIK